MTDPQAAIPLAALASAATGITFGADPTALLLALVSAISVTFWLQEMNSRSKAAFAVLFGTLLGAYGSPVAAEWIVATIPGIQASESLRMLSACAIGGAAPPLVPASVVRLKALIGGAQK